MESIEHNHSIVSRVSIVSCIADYQSSKWPRPDIDHRNESYLNAVGSNWCRHKLNGPLRT